MKALLIVAIVLQGLGLLFKSFMIVASMLDKETEDAIPLVRYCLISHPFAIFFECVFIYMLNMLA